MTAEPLVVLDGEGPELTRRGARVAAREAKVRMSASERREQLLDVGRKLFGEKGYELVTVEEIAAKANVSKPVVYEHFGGKEGLYAVVVDREMNYLLTSISDALTAGSARELLEQAGMALFNYIDTYPDGFRILVRDAPATASSGSFASLIVDVAAQAPSQTNRCQCVGRCTPMIAPGSASSSSRSMPAVLAMALPRLAADNSMRSAVARSR